MGTTPPIARPTAATALGYGVACGVFMVIAAVFLFVGFAGGYGVRELMSRRRRAVARRGHVERRAIVVMDALWKHPDESAN